MPSARATFRPCLLALCALPWLAGAQAAPQATPPSADLEFAATVDIASMQFDGAPRVQVHLPESPTLATRHDVEREGYAAPVEPGRRYRNVRVRTTISTALLHPALLGPEAAQPDAATREAVPAPASASPSPSVDQDTP